MLLDSERSPRTANSLLSPDARPLATTRRARLQALPRLINELLEQPSRVSGRWYCAWRLPTPSRSALQTIVFSPVQQVSTRFASHQAISSSRAKSRISPHHRRTGARSTNLATMRWQLLYTSCCGIDVPTVATAHTTGTLAEMYNGR